MTDRRDAVASSAAARWFCRTGLGRFVWVLLLRMPAYSSPVEPCNEGTTSESHGSTQVPTVTAPATSRLSTASAVPHGKLVVVNRKPSVWWWLLRLIAAVALFVVIVAAVRVLTFGVDTSPEVQATNTTEEFPWAAAAGTAERFVNVYYTVNETDPKLRTEALTRIVPAGVDIGGVEAKGVTRAQDATAIGTSTVEGRRFVTVAFSYWIYVQKDGQLVPESSQRLITSVPVDVIDGQTVPIGAPALVPETEQGSVTAEDLDVDSQLTGETADLGTAFFETLYSDRDLSALTAPNVNIDSLDIAGAQLESVSAWTVGIGGDTRRAEAVVKMRLGETLWTQRYSLDLVRATAGGGDRWLVAGLYAG